MLGMKTKKAAKTRWYLPICGILWLVGISLGSYFMFLHEFTPGRSLPAPQRLPEALQATIPTEGQKLTLFFAVHPDCPCTRASVEQLDRFLTKFRREARAVALFWTEDGSSSSKSQPTNSRYWERLNRLDTVVTIQDPQGLLAEKLGSLVSGATVAYDSDGKLVFQGGLTATRGHAGPSVGIDALTYIVQGKSIPELCKTPTFGCSLNEES